MLSPQASFIERFLIEQLGFHFPDVELEINNIKFDPSESATRVSYRILEGKGQRMNLGPRKVDRHVGIIQLDILVPEDTGDGDRDALGDFLSNKFNEMSEVLSDNSRFHTRVPGDKTGGVKDGLSRRTLTVPYWRDEPVK